MIYEDRTKQEPAPERTLEQRQRTIEKLKGIAADTDLPEKVRAMAGLACITEWVEALSAAMKGRE